MFFKLDLNRQVAWGLGPHVPWCVEEFTKKAGLKEKAPEKNGCPEGTTDHVIPASPAVATMPASRLPGQGPRRSHALPQRGGPSIFSVSPLELELAGARLSVITNTSLTVPTSSEL